MELGGVDDENGVALGLGVFQIAEGILGAHHRDHTETREIGAVPTAMVDGPGQDGLLAVETLLVSVTTAHRHGLTGQGAFRFAAGGAALRWTLRMVLIVAFVMVVCLLLCLYYPLYFRLGLGWALVAFVGTAVLLPGDSPRRSGLQARAGGGGGVAGDEGLPVGGEAAEDLVGPRPVRASSVAGDGDEGKLDEIEQPVH